MIHIDSITNRFKRSWEITKQTFHVMRADKEILLFPILSGIFSLILFVIFVFPVFLSGFVASAYFDNLAVLGYFGLFVFYFLITFSAVFFNAATVHIAKTRFEGGDATFMDGLKASFSHLTQIFSWSLLSATVGLILNILQNQARKKGGIIGLVGKILVSLIGFAWAIVSIFVVPAIVIKGHGPIEALKSSAITVKKTWGESLIRYYGLGFAQGIINGVGFIMFAIPGGIFIFGGSITLGLALIGIFILWLVMVGVIFSSANTVFNTALFLYADKGEVPKYYNKEVLSHAFKSSK